MPYRYSLSHWIGKTKNNFSSNAFDGTIPLTQPMGYVGFEKNF